MNCIYLILDAAGSHKSGRSPIIPWKDLKMHEKLGEGASGDVFRCTLLGESREAAIDSSIVEVDNDDEEVLVAVKLYKSEHTSDGRPEDEMNVKKTYINMFIDIKIIFFKY